MQINCVLFHVTRGHVCDCKSLEVLENFMAFWKVLSGSCSETCVTCCDDENEELNTVAEEAIDKKKENGWWNHNICIKQTEPEVKLCRRQLILPRPYPATEREVLKLHLTVPALCYLVGSIYISKWCL